jgi:hypothetical protein
MRFLKIELFGADSIVEKINIVRLPKHIISHFLNYQPELIIWNEKDEEWYKDMIADNSASTVLTAFEKIRKISRSIIIGNKLIVKLNNNTIEIKNIIEFENVVAKKLPMYKELIEFMSSEIEYKTKR